MILYRSSLKRQTWKAVADQNPSCSVQRDWQDNENLVAISLRGDDHKFTLELTAADAIRVRDWINSHLKDGKIEFVATPEVDCQPIGAPENHLT